MSGGKRKKKEAASTAGGKRGEDVQERLKPVFGKFRGGEEELIPVLQAVQAELGFLPDEAMREIARFTRVPESRVYRVASFYAQFRFKPIGRRHILVCRGTACHVRGAPKVLEEIERLLNIREGETTEDMEYTLETVACIGACGLSPCLMIDRKVEGKLTTKKLEAIFKKDAGK
ncbi:MAG TPA: NADH-quinone oxidoreductase subunit NuoE [Planctomycetes bacterium]|nr:NADH-quinone oxidoreductase subunit NuoE [Planctomycetota bacterium]